MRSVLTVFFAKGGEADLASDCNRNKRLRDDDSLGLRQHREYRTAHRQVRVGAIKLYIRERL
jgi:hypothetical protein